jgi:hypothetical protein
MTSYLELLAWLAMTVCIVVGGTLAVTMAASARPDAVANKSVMVSLL